MDNKNIETLSGLQHFTSLTKLDIRYCNVKSIAGLEHLTSLIELDCYGNQLAFLPELPSRLTLLNCGNNQLTEIPALPAGLISFCCDDNQLNTLPVLPPSLTSLECSQNEIITLPLLPSRLMSLGCSGNLLAELPELPPNLTFLDCADNLLSDLPSLPFNLEYLHCAQNQLTALPALPSGLTTLHCYNNYNLAALPALPPSLTWLDFNNDRLEEFPALPFGLKILVCGGTLLTELPLLPYSLISLDCSFGQLTSVNVTDLNLEYLNCTYNNMPTPADVKGFAGEWDDKDYVFYPQNATYSIITSECTEGMVSGGGVHFAYSTVTLTAIPNSNYAFNGWYENGTRIESAEAIFSFYATANRTLEARFIPIHTITYDANGGCGAIPTGSVAHGGNYTIAGNMFTQSGYSFTGWNTKPNGSGTKYLAEATISKIQEDITLYAQWTASGCDVPNGNFNSNSTSQTMRNKDITESEVPLDTGNNQAEEQPVLNPFTDLF